MSDLESTYRVKRPKRMANKRSKVTTPKGSAPNQAGVVILLLDVFFCVFPQLFLRFYLKTPTSTQSFNKMIYNIIPKGT